MYIDRIDLTLPEADLQSILAYFLSAEELLQPLPSVSKSDRKRYAKLGLKNEALALQILEVGRHNPDLIPRGINFERIDRDLTARTQLRSLKLLLERLLGRVDDSMLLTGVDLYAAALSIYHCLRRNADTTSLTETVDELKRGFARPSRQKKAEVEAEPSLVPGQDPMPITPQPRSILPRIAPADAAPAPPKNASGRLTSEPQIPLTLDPPVTTTPLGASEPGKNWHGCTERQNVAPAARRIFFFEDSTHQNLRAVPHSTRCYSYGPNIYTLDLATQKLAEAQKP